jgi:hypothetical protein
MRGSSFGLGSSSNSRAGHRPRRGCRLNPSGAPAPQVHRHLPRQRHDRFLHRGFRRLRITPCCSPPTFKLVQQLLNGKKALKLEALLKKLDRYAVVALDDIGSLQQDWAEMEVWFTFLAERYERRSVMTTSNLVFSKWDQIFKDPMTTMAAIDRLVHHATILEFDGGSVRAKKAKARSTP